MKKGMSLVSLITSVVIMIVMATTITVSGVNVSNNAKKIKFATEISYVKESVDSYQQKNSGSYPIGKSITLNLSQVNASDIYQFVDEDADDKFLLLYEIDTSLLGNIELTYGNGVGENDVYAVSKHTGNVYYIDGFKAGNKTYYTLTDELKNTINYVDGEASEIGSDGIVFTDSITEWTNQNVVTQVTVPKKYTNISVNVTKDNGTIANYGNLSSNTLDLIYVINIPGNYSILVTYKKADGKTYNQVHTVSNFDNVSPTLTCSKLTATSPEGSTKVIKVTSKSDNLSGIKILKYENETISSANAKSYFSSNGMNIQDDVIGIADGVKKVTVYIEDNAGNYKIINYSI